MARLVLLPMHIACLPSEFGAVKLSRAVSEFHLTFRAVVELRLQINLVGPHPKRYEGA